MENNLSIQMLNQVAMKAEIVNNKIVMHNTMKDHGMAKCVGKHYPE